MAKLPEFFARQQNHGLKKAIKIRVIDERIYIDRKIIIFFTLFKTLMNKVC